MSVAAASERLGVSEPTIRSWVKRGALSTVPKASPMQIEPESLHQVSRVLTELRERGQDLDWLQTVADLLHDREACETDALRKGISQLKRGQLELVRGSVRRTARSAYAWRMFSRLPLFAAL